MFVTKDDIQVMWPAQAQAQAHGPSHSRLICIQGPICVLLIRATQTGSE